MSSPWDFKLKPSTHLLAKQYHQTVSPMPISKFTTTKFLTILFYLVTPVPGGRMKGIFLPSTLYFGKINKCA
jgi:hypothetical protein